jgi:hypothetical protein
MDRLSPLVYRCRACRCGWLQLDRAVERLDLRELNWWLILRDEVRRGLVDVRA